MRPLRALGLSFAVAFAVATGALAQDPSPHAIEIPAWFAETFLDLRDDVRDAAKDGKRVMVYFGQDGCPYCTQLMETNFRSSASSRRPAGISSPSRSTSGATGR